MTEGAAELGTDLDEQIAFCVEAMKGMTAKLALRGGVTQS